MRKGGTPPPRGVEQGKKKTTRNRLFKRLRGKHALKRSRRWWVGAIVDNNTLTNRQLYTDRKLLHFNIHQRSTAADTTTQN